MKQAHRASRLLPHNPQGGAWATSEQQAAVMVAIEDDWPTNTMRLAGMREASLGSPMSLVFLAMLDAAPYEVKQAIEEALEVRTER